MRLLQIFTNPLDCIYIHKGRKLESENTPLSSTVISDESKPPNRTGHSSRSSLASRKTRSAIKYLSSYDCVKLHYVPILCFLTKLGQNAFSQKRNDSFQFTKHVSTYSCHLQFYLFAVGIRKFRVRRSHFPCQFSVKVHYHKIISILTAFLLVV